MSELDDLVDYSLDDANDLDMASASSVAEVDREPESDLSHASVLASLPSENELKLSRRVLELERERNALADQVRDLQSRVAPSTATPAPTAPPGKRILVPNELAPVLALLRAHIQDLTRENAALRYTFLRSTVEASPASLVSSIATTPVPVDSPLLGASPAMRTTSQAPSEAPGKGAQGDVDLAAVVERVRALMLENDELGDMVATAGSVDGEEWLRALEQSKSVIASLDSDLTHNLTLVESLRGEVEAYKTRFGSLDRARVQSPPQAPRGGGQQGGPSGGGGGGGQSSGRRRNGRPDDLYRPGDEQREHGRGGDRDRDRGGGGGGGRHDRDRRREVKPAGGISILGRAEGGRDARTEAKREEDRASKRRR